MQPINPDAFDAELEERRRQLQRDTRTSRPTRRTRILVVALLVALAAVVNAASFDARRARAHVEDVAVVRHLATAAWLQPDTASPWPFDEDPVVR